MLRSLRSILDDPRARGASLVLLAIVVFLPALRGEYLWDDTVYVQHNRELDDAAGLARIWFAVGATPQYYPLTFTTFWVEVHLWGRQPFAHHLVNVLLHGLAGLLLWRLLLRLEIPVPWITAAAFVLHPVCVESVAWITERKNVLSLALGLASALLYLRYARLGRPARAGGDLDAENAFLPSIFLFLGALLSKTVVAMMPVALLLVAFWKRDRLGWREDAVPLAPFAVLGVVTGFTTAWMERVHVGAQGADWSLSFVERLLLAGRATWFYAGKLLAPVDLIFIYPRWSIDASRAWQYVYPLGLALVVAGLWVLRRRIGKGPLTAALIYPVLLFPALGFFDVYPMRFSFVADHFQYHASIPLLAVIASAASMAAARWGWSASVRRAAAILILAALGLGTWTRTGAYADNETLWRDTLTRNPDAWIAHSNLAEILVARGELEAAIEHCRLALAIRPDLTEARGNLANALFLRGDPHGAMESYRRILTGEPTNAQARNNLGAVLDSLGRHAEAEAQFREAVAVEPGFTEARLNRANMLIRLGRLDEATAELERILRDETNHYRARMRLGDVRLGQGDAEAGERLLREALQRAREAGDTRGVADVEARLRFYGLAGG